jgi:hypothetical protein
MKIYFSKDIDSRLRYDILLHLGFLEVVVNTLSRIGSMGKNNYVSVFQRELLSLRQLLILLSTTICSLRRFPKPFMMRIRKFNEASCGGTKQGHKARRMTWGICFQLKYDGGLEFKDHVLWMRFYLWRIWNLINNPDKIWCKYFKIWLTKRCMDN